MAQFVFISALVASLMCYVHGQSPCSTPSEATGKCINLYDCSELVSIINKPTRTQQETQLLRKSQCGYDGNAPKVCCPAPPPPQDDTCFTPEGQQGRCVDIYSCPHLASVLKPPISQAAVSYVQKYICNTEKHRVCCGPPPVSTLPPKSPGLNSKCKMTAELPDPATRCCGVDNDTGDKIYGGNVTGIDQYPWLALIEYFDGDRPKLLCGGSLISGRYVLTAGHCVAGDILRSGTPRNVRLAEFDTSNEGKDCAPAAGGGRDCNDGIVVIPIEKIIKHPQYDPYAGNLKTRHDIALLRLRRLAPFTDYIRPICMPTNDITVSPAPDLTFYAAGWGAVSTNVGRSEKKMHVDLPFVPKTQCQPQYNVPKRNLALIKEQLCAGGVAGKDSCRGDSGGPLMYDDEEARHYVLIGIVSFGPSRCGMDVPAIYTHVFEYNSWIRSQIKP